MATLVCADVPKGVSVTLDHHQFDVDGELVGRGAWTGVRNLPPGAHFAPPHPPPKGRRPRGSPAFRPVSSSTSRAASRGSATW